MTTPLLLMAALLGVLGLAIGSFLNVVIHRVPRGESVVSPPSHCPGCDSTISNRHNVPVAGWLVLRGRCATCRMPISLRYPLVELGTGLLFAGVTLVLGVRATLPAFLFLAAAGLAVLLIIVDGQRPPGRFVLLCSGVVATLMLGGWFA